ncbi:MAG: hypothetical protein UX72_C0005G0010 [Parcubacteria group bacterium GW2011_GWA2_47_10]|nr:MAG: hypothetical protein UX72_C0005G0010 [Parcubacteria group bacterium GW2011_GWA2_47_10]OGZ99554.1 MAG: hypothetical protein A3D57_00405 [Candidatus Sungbacteria bacterium RIFCSPHIGHO2_02_FULL_46_12]
MEGFKKFEEKEATLSFEVFFKALNKKDLDTAKAKGFVPGTCTKDPAEALQWYYQYNLPEGKKQKKKEYGARRHIKRGEAVLVAFRADTRNFLSATEFQRGGVHEHERKNCWTSGAKTKAQINTPVDAYVEITDEELYGMTLSESAKNEKLGGLVKTLEALPED